MTEEALQVECFGGDYKVTQTGSSECFWSCDPWYKNYFFITSNWYVLKMSRLLLLPNVNGYEEFLYSIIYFKFELKLLNFESSTVA